jgi:ABC-2 type transport system permease protein
MMLRSLLALVRKDLLINLRQPLFLAITVAVPLLFVTLYALVVQVSATNPIAIARTSQGPASDAFHTLLQEMESVDGPFFRVLTLEPEEAFALYRRGEVGGVLEIPASFDAQLAHGEPAEVRLHIYNINSDGTKNLQLRLDHAIYRFQAAHPGAPFVAIDERRVFPRDMSIKTYLGTALLMFAVVFAAMLHTGSLLTREWEERTAKLVVLSPRGLAPLLLGKWLGALVLTALSTALVLLALSLTLGYPVASLGCATWAYLLAFFLYGAAIGALLGVGFQQSLPMVPVCVVVAVSHFFLSGYESYIRGLAHSGGLLWAWRLSSWWPLARLADAIRFDLAGDPGPFAWRAYGEALLLAAVLMVPAVVALGRRLQFAQGQ